VVAPPFRRRYEESEPLQGGKATSRGFVDEDVQRPAIALGVYRQTIVGFGLGVRNRQNVGFYKGLVKQNADQTHRQQQRQHQRNTALPAEAAGILKSAPDVAEDPEVQGYVNDYRNSLGRLKDRSSQRGGVDPVRRVIDRQKNKLKKELISKIRKSKIYQQGTKKLKKWIWRGIGPIGSIIEIEGLLCWTEFIFGLLVNGFQTLKSVVLPVVTEARPGDPNSGQIIKGVLSFAEPTSLDHKDPATWVIDAPYSAIWFFIINYVHLIVLAILTVIGSVVLVMSMGASVMGEYGTMIASMLGIT